MNVRKNSKLIRSGYYVFSGRGEFLNCLHCSALALLLHSAIKWPIQYPRTEKGLCGISKSEMLASECDPEGKKGESGGKALSVAPAVEKAETCLRTWWATGCSFSITIRSGASLPLNPISQKREQYREGGAKKKKQMCARERVALNPTHCKSPLDSVN